MIVEVKQTQMLCTSQLDIYNTPPTPGDEIPTTTDQW